MTFQVCPKCGAEVEGKDLGDHPCYLEFDCACGLAWGAQVELEVGEPDDTLSAAGVITIPPRRQNSWRSNRSKIISAAHDEAISNWAT